MKSEPELRKELLAQIANVSCFDEVERATQAKMLAWLADTPEYCRISKKPDYPTEHFALFNVCVTPDYQEILLLEHKKSGLLLTSGGHMKLPALTDGVSPFSALRAVPRHAYLVV